MFDETYCLLSLDLKKIFLNHRSNQVIFHFQTISARPWRKEQKMVSDYCFKTFKISVSFDPPNAKGPFELLNRYFLISSINFYTVPLPSAWSSFSFIKNECSYVELM